MYIVLGGSGELQLGGILYPFTYPAYDYYGSCYSNSIQQVVQGSLRFNNCSTNTAYGYGSAYFLELQSSTATIRYGYHYFNRPNSHQSTQRTFVYFTTTLSNYVLQSGPFLDLLQGIRSDSKYPTNSYNELDAFLAYDPDTETRYNMYDIGNTTPIRLNLGQSNSYYYCGLVQPCSNFAALYSQKHFIRRPSSIAIIESSFTTRQTISMDVIVTRDASSDASDVDSTDPLLTKLTFMNGAFISILNSANVTFQYFTCCVNTSNNLIDVTESASLTLHSMFFIPDNANPPYLIRCSGNLVLDNVEFFCTSTITALIYLDSTSSFQLHNTHFTGSSSQSILSVYHDNASHSLTIQGAQFEECNARGVSLTVSNGSISLVRDTFTGCYSSSNGGALAVTLPGGSLSILGCTFKDCHTSMNGGGLYLDMVSSADSFAITESEFSSCSAAYGGAMYFTLSAQPSTLSVSLTGYSSNTASISGPTVFRHQMHRMRMERYLVLSLLLTLPSLHVQLREEEVCISTSPHSLPNPHLLSPSLPSHIHPTLQQIIHIVPHSSSTVHIRLISTKNSSLHSSHSPIQLMSRHMHLSTVQILSSSLLSSSLMIPSISSRVVLIQSVSSEMLQATQSMMQ